MASSQWRRRLTANLILSVIIAATANSEKFYKRGSQDESDLVEAEKRFKLRLGGGSFKASLGGSGSASASAGGSAECLLVAKHLSVVVQVHPSVVVQEFLLEEVQVYPLEVEQEYL